uniref:Uncharacterized protein n=1 Tax=mine drainage metagenome TaxID=410659 RepID=E6QFA9_9ZZZZ
MILQTGTTATTQASPNQGDEMEQRINVVNRLQQRCAEQGEHPPEARK